MFSAPPPSGTTSSGLWTEGFVSSQTTKKTILKSNKQKERSLENALNQKNLHNSPRSKSLKFEKF